jgi:hypothetical protein
MSGLANNQMQRTGPGQDGAPQLISVFAALRGCDKGGSRR